jgi:hypothetical protein
MVWNWVESLSQHTVHLEMLYYGLTTCQHQSKRSNEHRSRNVSVKSYRGSKFKGIMFQPIRNVKSLTEGGFTCCTYHNKCRKCPPWSWTDASAWRWNKPWTCLKAPGVVQISFAASCVCCQSCSLVSSVGFHEKFSLCQHCWHKTTTLAMHTGCSQQDSYQTWGVQMCPSLIPTPCWHVFMAMEDISSIFCNMCNK